MPIILKPERRNIRTRLIVGVMYVLLTMGACSMVYPFLLMLSGSTKSRVDANDFDMFPRYLHDLSSLYRKHVEAKYSENLQLYLLTTGDPARSFKTVAPPDTFKPALVVDWIAFRDGVKVPASWYVVGYGPTLEGKIIQENERAFRNFIRERCGNDLARFKSEFREPIENWFFLKFAQERLTDRKYQLSGTPLTKAFYEFKHTVPTADRIYASCNGAYAKYAELKGVKQPGTLESTGSSDVWSSYVRHSLHPQFVTVAEAGRVRWTAFLNEKHGNIGNLNRLYAGEFNAFADVPFPNDRVHASAELTDYLLFVSSPEHIPTDLLRIDTPEIRWSSFLRSKYETLDSLQTAHGRIYSSFATVPMPQREADYQHCIANSGALKRRFMWRNFQMVFEYILLYGHGIRNTLIYCALSIALALLVNPLAAYALSRYNLPSQYKILLFLIATMAFPGVVTMIPNFLLLRDLGLLNTFAALLLPGMANGYAIFLLKGFFDSLPKELFEAADLDGATEWQKFWIITMNLSKPILAVIALGAFNGAYANFMYAFILCQDRSMWTLMVWLYQLQQFSSQGVVFASLIVAAIPTLLVFVLCQNIIIKGIVVPTEK